MFWLVTQLVIGLVVLGIGAEVMVRSSVRLAALFGIPSLLIGLTVVAFGTSAPELAVSLISNLKGEADLAVGNVVGSNILNILVVIGISALIRPLSVHLKIVKLEVPILIFLSGLSLYLARDGQIQNRDGIFLFALLIAYLGYQLYLAKKTPQQAAVDPEINEIVKQTSSTSNKVRPTLISLVLLILGIAGLVAGSNWFVEGASGVARHFGVNELIIGLTVVALGTSLPELATSIAAALKAENDIAIGNAVGSNIFNLCAVMGLTGALSKGGLAVSTSALHFDMPVMLLVAVLILPVLFAGFSVSRLEGFLFLALYGLYLGVLILNVINPSLNEAYTNLCLKILLPGIGFAFLWSFVTNLRAQQKSKPS